MSIEKMTDKQIWKEFNEDKFQFSMYRSRIVNGIPEHQCEKCSNSLNLLVSTQWMGWFCLECDKKFIRDQIDKRNIRS